MIIVQIDVPAFCDIWQAISELQIEFYDYKIYEHSGGTTVYLIVNS